MLKLLQQIISAYQKYLRSFLPKSCRFYPSCSNYAMEALEKHGIWKGLGMALARILRCHPLSRGGYDPVK